MIKYKPFAIRQTEFLTNLFPYRDRKEPRLTLVPKELHWLLLRRSSKTNSLLLDFQQRPKSKSPIPKQIQHKEPEHQIDITKQNLESIEPPELFTEINYNRRRRHHAYTLSVRNQSAKQNQEAKRKNSHSNLRIRQEKLEKQLLRKSSRKRPFTGFKPKRSSSSKESRTIHIDEKLFNTITKLKVDRPNKRKSFNKGDENSKYESLKQSCKPKTATPIVSLSRRFEDQRNQRYQSLIQNMELKPWQNIELSVYDDFNKFQ